MQQLKMAYFRDSLHSLLDGMTDKSQQKLPYAKEINIVFETARTRWPTAEGSGELINMIMRHLIHILKMIFVITRPICTLIIISEFLPKDKCSTINNYILFLLGII